MSGHAERYLKELFELNKNGKSKYRIVRATPVGAAAWFLSGMDSHD